LVDEAALSRSSKALWGPHKITMRIEIALLHFYTFTLLQNYTMFLVPNYAIILYIIIYIYIILYI